MNRKLPTPRDYAIGTFLLVILAIPGAVAIAVIGVVYWTSRAIRALAAPISEQEQIS